MSKPRLYQPNTKTFNNNGIGILSDAISCTVTEEINGIYELEMQYGIDGIHYSEIKNDTIIVAKPNEISVEQPFRIYKITKPMNGIVTVYAEHISYQLQRIPVSRMTASSAASSLSQMVEKSATDNPFTTWTDNTTIGVFSVEVPTAFRALLGGMQGSILDVYGGEYEFDRYEVKLHANRGKKTDVILNYGKNLTDLKQEDEISNLVTGVYPYWKNDDSYFELPEMIVQIQTEYSYPRIVPLDLSSEFEEMPTEDQLREAAQKYIDVTDLKTPRVSISVSFVQLWQTEEYKEIAILERVALCDTVTIRFQKLGVDATAKIVRTVYDSLNERYENMDIGNTRTNLSDTLKETKEQITRAQSSVEAAIANATAWITGANGGWVVFHKNADGQPYEMLVMDSPDLETAVNIWRWNINGLGFSKNGYNGPYESAMTRDGAFVADRITAGTLNANIIRAGTIKAGNGSSYWDLDGGDFRAIGTISNPSNPSQTAEYIIEMMRGALNVYINKNLLGGIRGFFSSGSSKLGFYASDYMLQGTSGTATLASYNSAIQQSSVFADNYNLRNPDGSGDGVLWKDNGQTVLGTNVVRTDNLYIGGLGPFRQKTITTDNDGVVQVLARV